MEKSIMRMVTVLYRKSRPYLSNALSGYNMTAAEEPFFMILRQNDGATQEELSSLVTVDKAATARAVKSLEEKGFVKRAQDEHDRRQNRVFLTDMGKECYAQVKQALLDFNKLLTQNINSGSLDIVYDALLQMEENAVNLSKGSNIQEGHKERGNGSGK